jgi:hypothetical protein
MLAQVGSYLKNKAITTEVFREGVELIGLQVRAIRLCKSTLKTWEHTLYRKLTPSVALRIVSASSVLRWYAPREVDCVVEPFW